MSMAGFILKDGVRYWGGGIDAEGHRYYKLKIQVGTTAIGDGPATVMNTPGLPRPGSIWLYENVTDPWAWCDGSVDITGRQGDGQREIIWDLMYNYSTRPRGQRPGQGQGGGKDDRGQAKKCADQSITNPLSEPPRTSGGSTRHQEEVYVDRAELPIRNTAFEPIKGPAVVFDRSRGQVTVEQNVFNLEYDLCMGMVDTVNDAALWSLDPRFWKLGEFHWERKLYGQCFFYYTRRFVFESAVKKTSSGNLVSGWDREVLDESSKVLYGRWVEQAGGGYRWQKVNFPGGVTPVFTNPDHYVVLPAPPKGGAGNVRMVLSRANRGVPATDAADQNTISITYYQESNFLLLGIPTVL